MSDGSSVRPIWRAAPAPPLRPVVAAGAELRIDGARGRAERRAPVREPAEGGGLGSGPQLPTLAGGGGPTWAAAGEQGDGAGSSDTPGGRQEGRGDAASPEPDRLDPRLVHVGETIAMVCRHEPAQCVWSARIPLDAELLPDTVLHLAYSPLLLILRFETSNWQVRSLLCGQLAALEGQVRAWMPAGAEVFASL